MSDRLQKHRKSSSIAAAPQAAESSTIVQPKSAPASIITLPVASQTAAIIDATPETERTPGEKIQPPRSDFLGHSLSRMTIRPKLTVSPPDDPSEREADQVAEQVMRTPEPIANRTPVPTQSFIGHDFSRVAVQSHLQPSERSPVAQTKRFYPEVPSLNPAQLSFNPHIGHRFGQIAVQRKPADLPEEESAGETPEAEAAPEEGIELDLPPEAEAASESESEEDELIQTKPLLQRATPNDPPTRNDDGAKVAHQLAQTQGGGNPLPGETRTFMESRFGADFGSVRVHTDASAVQLNRALNAQAFTHGTDVYFGAGYTPGKNALTAHELTHTIQQTGGLQAKMLNRRSNQDQESKFIPLPVNTLAAKTLQRREAPPEQAETEAPEDQTASPASTPTAAATPTESQTASQAASTSSASQAPTDSQTATPAQSQSLAAPAASPAEQSAQQSATAPADGKTGAKPATDSIPAAEDSSEADKPTAKPDAPAGSEGTFAKTAEKATEKAGIATGAGTGAGNPASTTRAAASPTPSPTGSPDSIGGTLGAPAAESPPQSSGAKEGSPASPHSDPDFKSVADRSQAAASQQKTHPPAGAKSAEAQAAAVPPGNEVESKAQDRQVQEADQQKPGTFNAAAFKEALLQKIAEITPKNEDEAKEFKDNNKIDSVKQDVSSQVSTEQKQASGPIDQKVKEQPDKTGIEPKPVKPLEADQPGAPPDEIDAKKAAPKSKPDAEVSQPLQEKNQQIDQQMAAANVTDEQLANSNEPQFVSALDAKKQSQSHANTAPDTYRQQEQKVVDQSQTQAQEVVQKQLQGMHGDRAKALQQVVGLQGETKGKDEQERTKVANDINAIYGRTKTDVEGILSGLDSEVNGKFDTGAGVAKKQFEDYVGQKMDAYKQERYGKWYDVTKWGNRIRDTFAGLPPEVNQFFVDGRKLYLDEMDKALTTIADVVANKLNQAKQRVAQGKQEIQKYVAGLPQSLRQVGQDAAQNMQGKFDELTQSIDNKQNELIDSLAQKYQDNLKQLDDRIEQMKEENKGLFAKAIDFIGGVINTIVELGKMLAGLLAKAVSAIPKILKDPIGFLGNLVSGLKQGFQNFLGNIWEHLKQGLIGWLTGALGSAGIQLPENFDLKGIFTLVMQLLGLVYDGIRAKAVKRLGEKTVGFLEGMFEPLMILKDEGIGGLWKYVQEKIGDLKAMVMDTLQSFVIETVIKQGIMWILSLLNPASAFVRACKALIDIVTFFIERGSQIMELVNAVLDAIIQISGGAVDAAAKAVENALVKALPVVISFLASLLGLGGISEKIREIIEKVRKPIDKAIDWIIDKAVKFAKKIGRKLGFGKDKKKGKDGKPDERTQEQTKADLEKAVSEAEQILNQQEATPDSIRAELPKLKSKYQLTSAKLNQDKDGDYYINVKINPDEDTRKRKFEEIADATGAFALYRGIHFQKNWSDEDYADALKKNLVGQPAFSAAAREIVGSTKPDGSDANPSDLEAAAQLVREQVEATKDVKEVRKWWRGDKQVFDNLFFAMIQDFVNRYDAFQEELRKAENGHYKNLEFISIPFISTSKSAEHGASYAFGQKGTLKENQRVKGNIIGRIYVYLFTAKELVDQGAINIQDLQNHEKVKIRHRLLNEAEVTFTGSIPGENLEAQHDALLSENPGTLGQRAKQTAVQKAQSKGGLRAWES